MYFKKATLDDLDTIIDILSDGRNQLAEAGVNQWQGDYPSRKQITADIMQGSACRRQRNGRRCRCRAFTRRNLRYCEGRMVKYHGTLRRDSPSRDSF